MAQRVIQRCVFPFERRLTSLYYRLERSQDSRLLDPEPPGRFSIWIPKGGKLFTDTYFNSFFEAYWRRYTKLGRLCLSVELSGRGTLLVLRRSNSSGLNILQEVDFDENRSEIVFEIPEIQLHHRELGSLHFDIVARSKHVHLKRAEWIALDVEDEPVGMVAATARSIARSSCSITSSRFWKTPRSPIAWNGWSSSTRGPRRSRIIPSSTNSRPSPRASSKWSNRGTSAGPVDSPGRSSKPEGSPARRTCS